MDEARRMAIERECERLVTAYCHYVDHGEAERVAELFSEDGVWASPELVMDGREQVRKMEPVLLKNLVRYGYEIHEPTGDELGKFKAKEKGVPEAVAKQVGPAGQKLLKAVRTALAK